MNTDNYPDTKGFPPTIVLGNKFAYFNGVCEITGWGFYSVTVGGGGQGLKSMDLETAKSFAFKPGESRCW